MNDLRMYEGIFDVVQPWGGEVPPGYRVDFLGTMTDLRFEALWGFDPANAPGDYRETATPFIGDSADGNAEFWFEAADWVLAATEARGSFVMVTLGASFGYQAVGSYRALQQVNAMPCKLVAVDPVPQNIEMTRRHFLDNGLDPADHWLIQAAISDSNKPVFFPIGAPGTGVQNCVGTDAMEARAAYVRQLVEQGIAEESLRSILLNNSTGITQDLVPGRNFLAEIKLVSAVTLDDLLGPFERVDYLEADIQQSEIIVFPPFIDLLKRKVRRIHLGTHGEKVHRSLHNLFVEGGWEVVFSYEPDSRHESALGTFKTNDGVLTVRNPHI
jgi:hypothetical protein